MRKILICSVSVICALGAGIGATYVPVRDLADSISKLFASNTAEASEIVATCEKDPNRTRCYEHEVPALFPSHTITEIFGVVREIRRLDPSYQFCHVLAHKLGETIVAEDPAQWLDAMSQNPPNSLCSNGFIHGVIVGRFRNDVLSEQSVQEAIPDFKRACEPRENWHPSPLDQAICYHGMGHLFTFITNADLRRALDICNAVGKSDTGNFLRVCREGVFMQIYQPLEPDDFELVAQLPIKPTKENYRQFCAAYSGDPEEHGACLHEAWMLFRPSIIDGSYVSTFCSNQPSGEEEDKCYQTTTAIIGRMTLGNPDKASDACAKLPQAREVDCFTSVAQAVLEEDQLQGNSALELCNRASPSVADECVLRLASRATFIFPKGSDAHQNFCALVPEEHRDQCIR